MKLPEIIENPYIQEELDKLENYSKNEKNLFYLLSIIPKTKFYPNLYEIPVEIHDTSILFDSRFESGNLRRVFQVNIPLLLTHFLNKDRGKRIQLDPRLRLYHL